MYFTLEDAQKTLWQRRRDFTLRRKVRDYLGGLPNFLHQGPRAVLARQLATPNFDFLAFVTKAKRIGLPAACPDYIGDKFCSCNPDKLSLAKMTFRRGSSAGNCEVTKSCKIIDIKKWDGKPLAQVRTLWGERLIHFHHRLIYSRFPNTEISDNTSWLHRMGHKPALFWPRLLALFLCDGVLFENFHSTGHESGFTETIIKPAMAEVESRFGITPLIVPLVPIQEELNSRWAWYPDVIENQVQEALHQLHHTPRPLHQPLIMEL